MEMAESAALEAAHDGSFDVPTSERQRSAEVQDVGACGSRLCSSMCVSLALMLLLFVAPLCGGVDAEELLRQKGNAAFQSKSFELACTFYSQAIEKNSENHVRV